MCVCVILLRQFPCICCFAAYNKLPRLVQAIQSAIFELIQSAITVVVTSRSFQRTMCWRVCMTVIYINSPWCVHRYGSETEIDEDEEAGVSNAARDKIYDKGQSRRIWGELYKVVDSSDVIVQVLSFM